MPTPCGSSINDWTLPTLIGSYIDLFLALLLLIGSTLVFIGSKLLSLLGFPLPCPCDGLFGCPHCLHSRIGSVHRLIRTRFPYDAVFTGSVPDSPSPPAIEFPGDGSVVIGRRSVIKRVRRRRGRSLSLLGEGVSDNFTAVISREHQNAIASLDWGVHDVSSVDEAAPTTECHSHNNDETPSYSRDLLISEGNESIIIQNLERELEEAQAGYSALCSELEKERSAAATAADEAMAMILRLQGEKAAVEMESSQYRRMVEEKSTYDEEEMEILKEIIVRREREKLVLEKEVDAYRQMISGETTREKHDPCFDSPDDPTELLKTIYESVKNKEKVGGKMKWAEDGEGMRVLEFPDMGEELNPEVQEKGMLTIEIYPSYGLGQSSSTEEDRFRLDLNKSQKDEFGKDNSCSILGEVNERESKVVMETPVENLNGEDGRLGDQRGNNCSHFEIDLNVLDVHVINEKSSDLSQTVSTVELHGKGDVTAESCGTSNVDTSNRTSVASGVGVDDIRRSCSDMSKGGQLLGSPSDGVSFDLRRSSMSAVDSERFTLETEVEILRKRLKSIQQDREKLSFPSEHQCKETFQLELLEEIACQLQQIRKITDPRKGIRRASLPPLPSKTNPKKRCCRSVSWGLNESA